MTSNGAFFETLSEKKASKKVFKRLSQGCSR